MNTLTFNDVSKTITTSFSIESFFPSRLSDENSHFRFKVKNTDLTFKLHYFHNYDKKDEEDIECCLHVYKEANKIGSYCGEFSRILEVINNSIDGNTKEV